MLLNTRLPTETPLPSWEMRYIPVQCVLRMLPQRAADILPPPARSFQPQSARNPTWQCLLSLVRVWRAMISHLLTILSSKDSNEAPDKPCRRRDPDPCSMLPASAPPARHVDNTFCSTVSDRDPDIDFQPTPAPIPQWSAEGHSRPKLSAAPAVAWQMLSRHQRKKDRMRKKRSLHNGSRAPAGAQNLKDPAHRN